MIGRYLGMINNNLFIQSFNSVKETEHNVLYHMTSLLLRLH